MTTHAESRMHDEPHGVSLPMPHHAVPYFAIFFALLVLTASPSASPSSSSPPN